MTPEERDAEKVRQDAAKANELKAIEEGRRKFIADIDLRLKNQQSVTPYELRLWKKAQKEKN